MTISSVSNDANYLFADLQPKATAVSTSTGRNSVSLSTDSIDFALNGEAQTTLDSTPNDLFYSLNQEILYPTKNLAGVGSAVDVYTNSLASSNVYDSSYTAPSAKFLADLAAIKTAAASGNQPETESSLAVAKGDAPGTVSDGFSVAIATGDTAGEAALEVEATANISDNLRAKGYSPREAMAEATAIQINGLSENAVYTASYTGQTRLQQITDLAFFAGDNSGSARNSVASTANNPLFNIYETLLEAKSGTATDQSLTSLDAQYGSSTTNIPSTGLPQETESYVC